MGCGSSKLETESAVKKCRARKSHMKQAVAHRHKFAAAHASYAKSLRSMGAAIWQVADVDDTPEGVPQPAPASIAVRPPVTNLPPPPQPPDDTFSGRRRVPLPRAASMPPIPFKSLGASSPKSSFPQGLSEDNEELHATEGFPGHKPTHSDTLFDPFDYPGPGSSTFENEEFESKLPEAEDDEVEDETVDDDLYRAQIPVSQGRRSDGDTITMGREMGKQQQMPPLQQKVGKADLNFRRVIYELDGLFLRSHEAAGEVSRLLEAKKDYHHASFIDEREGIEEHNMKVSKILSWSQSSPGRNLANDDATGAHNLASTLDRLLAWEKKLYEEVKTAEATRLELTRRSAHLRNLRGGHEASSTFAKTKALVKSLNTRYLVEIEATDAASAEIKKLRDEILYPQMMTLLEALKKMWKIMHDCHQSQIPWVDKLRNLPTPSTHLTSEICKKYTEQLEEEVVSWYTSVEEMVELQQKFVVSLREWLHLNVSDNEATDYLPASQEEDLVLYEVCNEWERVVKQLAAAPVVRYLMEFSTILRGMVSKQADEIKQKRIKEERVRELEKKTRAFEVFVSKYKEKAASKGAPAPEGSLELARHPIQEKRALVQLLQKTVAEEEERYAKLCEENSFKIFESLKDGLPDVVHSIAEFSQSCAMEYALLYDRFKS